MPKRRHWSCEDSAAFWAKRRCYMAMSYPDIPCKQECCAWSMKERLKQEENQKQEFYSHHNLHDEDVTSTVESAYKIAKDLTFWMENSLWSYCKTCKLLDPQKLLPSYGKRPQIKTTRRCSCINKRCLPKFSRNSSSATKPHPRRYLYTETPGPSHWRLPKTSTRVSSKKGNI